MGGAHWVVAFGHQHAATILYRHGFIKAAVIGVNTLKGEPLFRVNTVVVGLFQV